MTDPIHSKEAEESVIGGLLASEDAWNDVSELIAEKDFYFPYNQTLFKAIGKLVADGQPVDSVTLAESLDEQQLESVGGLGGIIEIISNVPSVRNVTAYAQIVKDHATLRRLQQAGEYIQRLAESNDDPDALVDKAEAIVGRINEERDRGEGPVGMAQLLSSTMGRLDELCSTQGALTGLSTGFREIDEATTGLQDADLIIVAGRPSMGKSAFMMNLAEAALLANAGPVIVFSLEMPHEALTMRMLSGLGRVDSNKMRAGTVDQEELARVTTALSILHNKPLFIDDAGYMTPALIRSRVRKIQRVHGKPAMIVVDYLQLMSAGSKHDNRNGEITEISRQLKAMAKEFDCPVVAGSQLNRSLESRSDKRPVMSDLRESGAIEQDADVIMALYRDEVYYENTPDKGLAEVLILKQRNGPIGRKKLAFLGMYTRFEDAVPQPLQVTYSALEKEGF